MSDQDTTPETPNTELSVDDLLLAQAIAEQNKPPQVKKTAVLASIVEFLNGNDPNWKHVENKYPTMTKATLKKHIDSVPAIKSRCYPINTENFGLVIVRTK